MWRKSKEYRLWRAGVIRRDGRCVVCGSIKDRQAHHIEHAKYKRELRFELTNGICLCGKCHSQFHNNFIGNTNKNCSRTDLNNFLELIIYIRSLNETTSAS